MLHRIEGKNENSDTVREGMTFQFLDQILWNSYFQYMKFEQDQTVCCPYCGEEVGIVVDCTIGSQQFVEDCQVCCRPIQFSISLDNEGNIENLQARSDDE